MIHKRFDQEINPRNPLKAHYDLKERRISLNWGFLCERNEPHERQVGMQREIEGIFKDFFVNGTENAFNQDLSKKILKELLANVAFRLICF